MLRRHLQPSRVATSWGRQMSSPLISALVVAGSSAREAILILVSGGSPLRLWCTYFHQEFPNLLSGLGWLVFIWYMNNLRDEMRRDTGALIFFTYNQSIISSIHYWDGRWLARRGPCGWEVWSETLMFVSLYLYRLQPGRLWPCSCKEQIWFSWLWHIVETGPEEPQEVTLGPFPLPLFFGGVQTSPSPSPTLGERAASEEMTFIKKWKKVK